jgi:pimeloyl-ACP methyl ester carboxylesterase
MHTAHRRPKTFIVLASLAVLIAALSLFGDWRTDAAEAKFPPIGQFVTADSVRMHYAAKGDGRPVVMIHGTDGVLQDFTYTILDSVATFALAIAFDRPGHGYSGRPDDDPLTLQLNARLIHDAVGELGLSDPIVVGHSYGTAVALKYALDYPHDLSGLVLLSPAVYADGLPVGKKGASFLMGIPNWPIIGPLLKHCLIAPLFGYFVPHGLKSSFAPNPESKEYSAVMAALMPRPGEFGAFADENSLYAHGLNEQSPLYSDIKTPTVIIAGDSDQIAVPSEEAVRLANAMPHAQLIMLHDVGHMVHYARPDVVTEAIRRMVVGER